MTWYTNPKKYKLNLPEFFPSWFSSAGQQTDYWFKARVPYDSNGRSYYKSHQICENYRLWADRVKEVKSRDALLLVGQYEKSESNDGELEFNTMHELSSCSNIAVERLTKIDHTEADVDGRRVGWKTIAENEGLTESQLMAWVNRWDSSPKAIVHFTKFRYSFDIADVMRKFTRAIVVAKRQDKEWVFVKVPDFLESVSFCCERGVVSGVLNHKYGTTQWESDKLHRQDVQIVGYSHQLSTTKLYTFMGGTMAFTRMCIEHNIKYSISQYTGKWLVMSVINT